MEERRTTERTILCKCGHPLSDHAMGAGQCYRFRRRIEKRKTHLGKEVKVKCVYECTCKKFEFDESTENIKSTHSGGSE